MFAVETRPNKRREWQVEAYHQSLDGAWKSAEEIAAGGKQTRVVNERGAVMEAPQATGN